MREKTVSEKVMQGGCARTLLPLEDSGCRVRTPQFGTGPLATLPHCHCALAARRSSASRQVRACEVGCSAARRGLTLKLSLSSPVMSPRSPVGRGVCMIVRNRNRKCMSCEKVLHHGSFLCL